MHKINLLKLYLEFILLSPIFYFLFGLILFMFLKGFDSILLCDELTLEELKNFLEKETNKYNELNNKYQEALDFYDEWRARPSRGFYEETETWRLLGRLSGDRLNPVKSVLKDIRNVESDIRKLDPSFVSKIEKQ